VAGGPSIFGHTPTLRALRRWSAEGFRGPPRIFRIFFFCVFVLCVQWFSFLPQKAQTKNTEQYLSSTIDHFSTAPHSDRAEKQSFFAGSPLPGEPSAHFSIR